MSKVIPLSNDAGNWTMEQLIAKVHQEFSEGAETRKKGILILVDDEDFNYDVRALTAGTKYSEIVALLEFVKLDNYIDWRANRDVQ